MIIKIFLYYYSVTRKKERWFLLRRYLFIYTHIFWIFYRIFYAIGGKNNTTWHRTEIVLLYMYILFYFILFYYSS